MTSESLFTSTSAMNTSWVTDLYDVINGDVSTVDHVMAGMGEKPGWRKRLDVIQGIMLTWGMLTNIATVVSLFFKGSKFSPKVRHLLQHQALLDSGACVVGFVILVQPLFWSTGSVWFDTVVCFAWHSQFLYWYFMLAAIHNLVYIAFERYLAVVRPLYYKDLPNKVTWYGIAAIDVFTLVIGSLVMAGAHMEDNRCTGGNVLGGDEGVVFDKVIAVIMYVFYYITPSILLFFFYGSVIITMRKKTAAAKHGTHGQHSSVLTKGTVQLTRAAAAVTAIYFVTFSYALNYYVFGTLDLWWRFVLNSPVQQVNVFMTSINSMVNPTLYWVFMPAFRRSVVATYLPCLKNRIHPDPVAMNGMSTSIAHKPDH